GRRAGGPRDEAWLCPRGPAGAIDRVLVELVDCVAAGAGARRGRGAGAGEGRDRLRPAAGDLDVQVRGARVVDVRDALRRVVLSCGPGPDGLRHAGLRHDLPGVFRAGRAAPRVPDARSVVP